MHDGSVPMTVAPRPARQRLTLGLLAVGLVVPALAGCTSADAPVPAATTTTGSPDTAGATVSPTTATPAFDCATVGTAQQELDEAFTDELSRLDIGRGDPRAQSVYALVTTTQGPEYYSAVLAAAPPELGADAQSVLDYYQQLADRVGTVDTGDGSTEALTAAMTRLDDATAEVDDPTAGTAVVEAQERLQAAVQQSCSGAETATATGSPTDTATTGPPTDGATDGRTTTDGPTTAG